MNINVFEAKQGETALSQYGDPVETMDVTLAGVTIAAFEARWGRNDSSEDLALEDFACILRDVIADYRARTGKWRP